MGITTVGELKRRLASLPDSAPLTAWVLDSDARKLCPLEFSPLREGEIRFPDGEVVELIFRRIE